MFSAPRSRREPGRRERGSARGGRRGEAASRGQGRARSDGGRGRKISFSNLLPSVFPPSFLFSRQLLGVNRIFFLLGKMDPASREGEGRGWRERRRRGPGFFFILASSFPPLLRAAAARARSRPPVPAGARSGPVIGARPPADWPFPVASPPGSQAPPRTARPGPDEPSRGADDPRPNQESLAGPARPGRRDERP